MILNRSAALVIGIPVIIILVATRFFIKKKEKKKFVTYKEVSLILLYLYIVALISITLFPITTFRNIDPTANLVPIFNTIKDICNTPSDMQIYMIKFWIVNIVGNLLLLAPLATIMPILNKKYRNLKSLFLLCFVISVLIEFTQYVSMYLGNFRSVDIDDVILNTLGAVIGFAVFKVIDKKYLTN